MPSLIFFDPNRNHVPSLVDPDILLLRCSHCLYDIISTYKDIQHLVCVCCPDSSMIIDHLAQIEPDVLIRLCREEHRSQHNLDPDGNDNMRGDPVLNFKSNWEVQCRNSLIQVCRAKQYDEQARNEAQKFRIIVQPKPDQPRSSIPESPPSNTLNGSNEAGANE